MKIALNGFVTAVAVALVAFLGGCGPQNLNDEAYLAQLAEAGLDQNGVMSKDDQGASDSQSSDDDGSDDSRSEAPAAAPMAPMNMEPVVKLPPRHLRAPTVVERQPTVVLNSGEVRNTERDVHHWRTILKPQLTLTKHRVHHRYTENHKYHTNIVHNPSTCTQVYHTHEALRTDEVEPTVETTSPVTVACPGPGICGGRGYGFGGYPGFGGGYRFGRAYWVR